MRATSLKAPSCCLIMLLSSIHLVQRELTPGGFSSLLDLGYYELLVDFQGSFSVCVLESEVERIYSLQESFLMSFRLKGIIV